MPIEKITADDLRDMEHQEGLVLQGCGGEAQEWLDGINDLLTQDGILQNGSRFETVKVFQHDGLNNLLFPFENFKLDLPEQPVEITADGTRLYRVFQNLLQNALNYSLPGSRVYLSLKTTDKAAVASIRNTSRNELPEGVDFTARFVRGDESRTDGGTGLGLSVAKSFTEACGGTFRVETMADLFTAIVSFPVSMHEPKR